MTGAHLVIDGEPFVRIEAVAVFYEVEVTWIEEVVELGLIARTARVEGALLIAAVELDRLARIVSLHRYHDVNLPGIAWILERPEADPWSGALDP